ncbi:transporter substrate-binding domain-containing protein [Pseudomonas sp. Bout1]|uniref:transporter substrate-binding domain-containing protein n=1 Tax=Pseudomonas sp. Bout1 TaxID=3048600 RepID=UPI002AB53E14|nr:transporter substrate-binding domain-containing protein [Pseudomonas sp. Bout1]MDY7536389.1 transporter substrate-binding domain-containing protein [Pseudomonas sp. Bout1]MEB0183448.1 transporter substrate-binding domain-containing protein [Pseudomonas sp. Bout1]
MEPAQLRVRTPVLAPKVAFDPDTRAWLDTKPTVRVAFWGSAQPPLSEGYEPDVFEGVAADVLGLLQQTMDVHVEMQRYGSRDEASQALAGGDVDMLGLNDVTLTTTGGVPSSPYLLNRQVIVRRANESQTADADISRGRLTYFGINTLKESQLRQQYPGSTLVPFTNHLNAMAALAYGQIDAVRTNAITAEYLISRFYRNELVIAGNAVAPNIADINFSVSVHAPQLLSAINQTLAAIPVAGMLRITSRWGLSNNFVIAHTSLNLSPQQKAWISAHPTAKVMVAGSYAPLTFFDERDRLQGLTADLLRLITRRTGLEFELVRSKGIGDMVERLEHHQADLIAAVSIGDFRLSRDQYTRPYLISPFVVVTRRSQADIRSLDELNGLKLAMPMGNPMSTWVEEKYPGITLVPVESATRGLEMLMAGEVDGSVQTQFGANYFINYHFQQDLHIAAVFGPVPAAVAMAVDQDQTVLKDIINQTLLEISPEELQEITVRWSSYVVPAVASPWSTYKDTVYMVIAGAALFALVFLIWNYFLRVQINQRKKAEQALGDQLEFTRTLIDGAPVALYVRDEEGRLVQCNRAYLDFLQTSADEVVGKTLLESDHVSPHLITRYHQFYLDILKEGQPTFGDLEVQVKGESFQLYHWVLPFHNSAGRYVGLIGGWLDITERAHLTEQLRLATETAVEASRSKSVFLASMSHEIRTPISALIGLIEMLRLRGGTPAQREENLEVAHQSAQSLLSLIGDILDLSKIEAGAMKPSPRPTHLVELMQSLHTLFATNARKKQLDYTLSTQVTHHGVMIDALMLNQIVSNLLSNAIKFTGQGSVQLLLRELPDARNAGYGRFAIQVSDTGAGLTTMQQHEIFEPFVQADPGEHRARGTGLGLSICVSLARLLEAQLSVDSQPGLGSRFTLVFEAPLAEIAEDQALQTAQMPSGHRLKILVVEDHAPNRLLLCQQLEYLGHDAVPCDDGESALALWEQASPLFDLTITDCGLPGMDGYELTRRMRDWEQGMAQRAHPIFGLTANAQSEVVERCLAAGMNRCLFKPIGIEALAPLIGDVAQQSERRALAAASNKGGELEKIRLLSPESYGPLVEEILKTHRQDALELTRLLALGDVAGLGKLAHKIRGGAYLTGDAELSAACGALESAAQAGSLPTCYPAAETLQARLQALEERLLS